MENASKALIMAGGMLIGILILSLGLYMFITFSDRADKVYDRVKEDQIAQFNSRFIYEDKDVESTLTIYDVVNVAKRAREYNQSNELFDESSPDYIIVELVGEGKIEKYDDSELEDLLEADREDDNMNKTPDPKLPNYQCIIKDGSYKAYNDEGRIHYVRFKKIP